MYLYDVLTNMSISSSSISAICSMSISVYDGVLQGVAMSPYLKLFLLCLQSCHHLCSSSLFLAGMTCWYVKHVDLQCTVCHFEAVRTIHFSSPGPLLLVDGSTCHISLIKSGDNTRLI